MMSSLSIKKDLAALGLIELVADPVASSFGNFTPGNDGGVIDEYSPAELRVEDLMVQHHEYLVVNFSDIGLTALGKA
ncbi:hypothetical protein [Pseudomonas syringae]|uniref:Uncharacterized protein n=1 Tax=Pseudomonas syringae pv. japonica str. M301072 TaxID=629262 RepID=F3FFY5_PSESX|nr:hypothetical protein [Pseudomonas syringae]EGH29121.1 hypothetical protein PSYJA_09115 [Pseudomonas syringae pv. japonica str. M301072]ELQ00520.1 hypothetical protein A979_11705 [Pseudomonas syringae BRIP34876]ELQ06783.1 hypothetical protein A987_00801 [Pseudomonas syringae BRIP34881]